MLSCFDHSINKLEVHTVSSQQILDDALSYAHCLIMPGGADLPYCRRLNGAGNQKIRDFVADGNLYIGICAGAYYASSAVDFRGYAKGKAYEVCAVRELGLFAGTATGSITALTNGRLYDETTATKAVAKLQFPHNQNADFYYHGGPFFNEADASQILSTYDTGDAAIVCDYFGKGQYLLSGVHFELCAKVYQKLVIENTDKNYLKKEKLLFELLKNENYGKLIYREIAEMFNRQHR